MEAIRKIIDAERLLPIIDLPESMKKLRVEIIVLPFVNNVSDQQVKSMKGFLKDYANTALIEQEKNAWERAAVEKHGNI